MFPVAVNFLSCHKNVENVILSSALQELLMHLETTSMFLNPFSFSQQLLQHCQVTFSGLTNLPVLCWNQLQMVQILLAVQHPNPKTFVQLNLN